MKYVSLSDPSTPYTVNVDVPPEDAIVLQDFAEADGPWQLAKAVWKHFPVRDIVKMPWGAVKSWWTGEFHDLS